jgi:hypothetical protein
MGIMNAMSNGDKIIEKVLLGMSHHKSLQTSMLYQKPNKEMFLNYNRAILGKRVATSPKKAKGKKINKKQKKEAPSSEEPPSDAEAEVDDINYDYDAAYNEDSEIVEVKPPARVSSTNSTVDGWTSMVQSASVSLAPPKSIEAQETESRAVSLLSGSVTTCYDGTVSEEIIPRVVAPRAYDGTVSEEIIPCVVAPRVNVPTTSKYPNPFMHPIFQNHHHQSNHIQRNIFVHPHSMANIEPTTYY